MGQATAGDGGPGHVRWLAIGSVPGNQSIFAGSEPAGIYVWDAERSEWRAP